MCQGTDRKTQRLSLYEEGFVEAQRHKWIESQKRGMDVGMAALDDWYSRFWPHYCRHKRLEHLEGSRRWREFQDDDFGLIYSLMVEGDLLLDRILDRVQIGMENLDLICWAHDWGLPMDRVIQILTQLNLNCARLEPLLSPRHNQQSA
jgi:hypothetical protein